MQQDSKVNKIEEGFMSNIQGVALLLFDNDNYIYNHIDQGMSRNFNVPIDTLIFGCPYMTGREGKFKKVAILFTKSTE